MLVFSAVNFFSAHFAADRLDAVEIGDRRLVPVGMVDAPGGAMRPVDANAIADLAAEQFVAGHPEQFCLGVEQRVFDRAERLRNDAAGGGAGRRKKLRIDAFVLEGVLSDHARRETLDRSADAGRAKAFVEFAPADDAVLGGDLDEVVVSPAGVAGEQFDASYLRYLRHGVSLFYWRQSHTDSYARPYKAYRQHSCRAASISADMSGCRRYSAACDDGGRMVSTPSASVAEIVVRIIRRASCAGHGRPRCMVARLSHITTSPLRHWCR